MVLTCAVTYCKINYLKYLLYLLYYLKIQKIKCNNFTFECDEQYLQVLRLDIILDVEILLQRPVHELSEEDLSASVLVDLVKLRSHVLDWSHPLDKKSKMNTISFQSAMFYLLNCLLHLRRGKFLFIHSVVHSSVQSNTYKSNQL